MSYFDDHVRRQAQEHREMEERATERRLSRYTSEQRRVVFERFFGVEPESEGEESK